VTLRRRHGATSKDHAPFPKLRAGFFLAVTKRPHGPEQSLAEKEEVAVADAGTRRHGGCVSRVDVATRPSGPDESGGQVQ